MGTLRLLLALWVVAVHGRTFFGLEIGQAWVAVECFFIISGFFMSLILNEKYTGTGSTTVFLSQRLLRLLPAYGMVVLLTLAASGLAWGWWGHAFPPLRTWLDHHRLLDGVGKGFLAMANAVLVGQAETFFLGLEPVTSQLQWTTDFSRSQPMVWQFLALPQAWSLELELLFYALAPWVVRRSALVLVVLLVASLAVRLGCYAGFNLTFDPWTHRFFPNEMALFLLGALAYKIYRSPWRARAAEGVWIWALFALFLALTVAFPFIPVRGQLKAWPYFLLTTATLPFLFAETKNWRWDRWLGELSFPIYLIHFLVIWICEASLPASWQHHRSLWAMLGTVAASIVLLRTALTPFENWRAARARRLLPIAEGHRWSEWN